jgi:two-component system sensor histidine kinase KdpD
MSEQRARAEDFLELVERAKRGRLKVYIGPAAGVGKTYQMLEEAHTLKKRGVDVVLAFIETHDREETAALVVGLEEVPRRRFEYRGVMIEDMDLDAVLARRPQAAIVDELPHTNAPGSRNKKRYQDVFALLDAGINVICAMNVQHVESLNDLVKQATGVTVRETVPDTFLKQADQVVNLDLAAEDLLDRLRAGKIYGTEKIDWALRHFFKPENLSILREVALREVADSVDRSTAERIAASEETRKVTASDRVMVCLSSYSPAGATLLRRGSRMAGRLNTDWYVVFVETPREAPHRISAEAQRVLIDNEQKARELGAQVVRLRAPDPVTALLEFARAHGVMHLIVGRSHQPKWRQALGRTVTLRLAKEADGFDVHLISLDKEEGRT